MIKQLLIGHLGKDAIINNVNGRSVINLSVAHSEKYKDSQGNQKNKTIWVDCSWWTERAAILPYLKKGTMVYVEGKPDVRLFEYAGGDPGVSMILNVNNVQLLGKANENSSSSPGSNQRQDNFTNPADMTEPLDDLPF